MITNKENFVQALKSDGVYLRHCTNNANWNKIKEDGYLKANTTTVENIADPGYLPILLTKYTPIKAVYFQLVKSMFPRFGDQYDVVESFFTPDVILSSEFVLHSEAWWFGLDQRATQYCSDPQISQHTNTDLDTAYREIRYFDSNEEMNEILITKDVPLKYCVNVLL